ncbi:hypothetical protein BV378_20590 [Nostoc sp. RF31YmG]|jgi:hypothetical protein|nr:hypothetical protein BV378_20590 [Nostoc sp. RF31YmG]
MLAFEQKWYRVSLRLMGDNLAVQEIEAKLDLVPRVVAFKGEHRHRNPRYAKYRTNFWRSQYLTNSDVPFEQQIAMMLDVLEPRLNSLKEILSLPDVEGDLYLGFRSGNGQGGAFFSNELLRRIADYGLALTLDLYDIDAQDAPSTP